MLLWFTLVKSRCFVGFLVVVFFAQIQNDQCQEMDTSSDKWVKLTDNGEWGSHSVSSASCLFVGSIGRVGGRSVVRLLFRGWGGSKRLLGATRKRVRLKTEPAGVFVSGWFSRF